MELDLSIQPRPESAQAQIERVNAPAELAYARVVEIFERELGGYSRTIATTLVADRAPWPEAEQAFTLMAGEHGLMIMAKTESGSLTTLAGRQRCCTLYLVGNPLIANQLFDIDVLASFYFPFRVAIFSDAATGRTYIAYDRPSSVLRTLKSRACDNVGNDLDLRLRRVVDIIRRGI